LPVCYVTIADYCVTSAATKLPLLLLLLSFEPLASQLVTGLHLRSSFFGRLLIAPAFATTL